MSASVTVADLIGELRGDTPPLLLDVRRRAAYESAGHRIAGSVWLDPEQVGNWAPALAGADAVVVYCVRGHEVSRNCAAALQARGIRARFLEGGIEAFSQDGAGHLVRRPA